jgi:hypothetical protein
VTPRTVKVTPRTVNAAVTVSGAPTSSTSTGCCPADPFDPTGPRGSLGSRSGRHHPGEGIGHDDRSFHRAVRRRCAVRDRRGAVGLAGHSRAQGLGLGRRRRGCAGCVGLVAALSAVCRLRAHPGRLRRSVHRRLAGLGHRRRRIPSRPLGHRWHADLPRGRGAAHVRPAPALNPSSWDTEVHEPQFQLRVRDHCYDPDERAPPGHTLSDQTRSRTLPVPREAPASPENCHVRVHESDKLRETRSVPVAGSGRDRSRDHARPVTGGRRTWAGLDLCGIYVVPGRDPRARV